ncbi:extracellular solute-binding protein [Oceanotoga sp. DSM 15011]|uniref:extracellular solute-binding protein n=1 Tax=Oceanotoga sp. DSM 15011 TaxID=2984951 RepID=UPI0021F4E5AB|nr:extracellular solute-binding protein [Oceanotoga sp. DSM 15011]UYO98876.1 extracellular solute-binding protein [Oceanotoga sp. DSM 15011]
MKKLLAVLLTVLIFSFAFSEKVVFEFWHAMGGGLGETLSYLIENFNKENPDIEVKPIYVGNYSALNQKLLSTITAYNQGTRSELPTMAQAYGNWIAKYLFSDVIQPLNEYIENDKEMKDAWDNEIYDVFKEMSTWDENIYSMPYNKSVYTYYYNTDLFDLYGVEPPKSFDDLIEVSQYLTEDIDEDGNVDQYGLGSRTFVDDFQLLLYAYDQRILVDKGNGKYAVSLDKTKFKEALSIVKELKENDNALFQGGYLDGPFGSGQIAAYMGTIAGKSYADRSSQGKHGWTWSALPSVDGVPHSPIAGTDLTVFKWASDEEKEAAFRFLKYLMDPINMAYWAINSGYVPVRKDVTQTEQWKVYTATDEKPTIALNSLETAYSDPKPAAWNDIRGELSNIYSDFLNDKIDSDEAYSRTIKSLETLLAETDELAK